MPLHIETSTRSSFCTRNLVLPWHPHAQTYAFTLTQKPLHRADFAHRSLYTHICLYTQEFYNVSHTQKLLHTQAFTHRNFNVETFYTQMPLRTESCTRRSFYAQKLLHTDVFTDRSLYYAHRSFYTQMPLHKEAFIQNKSDQSRFYKQKKATNHAVLG